MTNLRKVLAAIAYVGVGGGPLLASTGVGLLWGAAIGAVGLVAGATLHLMDNPKDAKAAAELGTTVKGAIEAVKAARPGKGQSGS